MLVAAYIRTSEDEPGCPAYDDQKSLIEDYCLAEGFEIAAFYEDLDQDGRDKNRPGYIRMMAEMQAWDAILVSAPTVIHTNALNFSMMLRRLEREGKGFISVSGGDDPEAVSDSKRAAVYVRVSTEEQAMEGYSLGAQRRILEDFCESEAWTIQEIYEDDGFSGRTANRPAYKRMMANMDKWDVLLVIKMDRIHRNFRNFMSMMELLERNGKQFASYSDNLDTSNAVGRFATDVIQRIAQLESEQTGERTYIDMREKAETLERTDSGKRTMGFTPPFGYTLEDGRLSAVDGELEVVRGIFSMYRSGTTIDMICYELNRSGTLTRKGNPWNKFNLRNILHNPVYAGYMRWEDILIRHDAAVAVSPEEYNEVQELMASRVRDPSKRRVFLLPTLLRDRPHIPQRCWPAGIWMFNAHWHIGASNG